MPQSLIKLVTVLLLFVQGAVALSTGRMLCIPVAPCGEQHSACDDTGSASHVCGAEHCADHRPGLTDVALHPHDECDCHVHLPIPGGDEAPSNSSPRSDLQDLRAFALSLWVVSMLGWGDSPSHAPIVGRPAPSFSASDQVLGLRATRLLI